MDDEILRCISAAREEIRDTIAYLVCTEDWLEELNELSGEDIRAARAFVAGYIKGARNACTSFTLSADRLLWRLGTMEDAHGQERDDTEGENEH